MGSENQNTMKLLPLLIPLSLASPPLLQINNPLPSMEEVVAALQTHGALIFTGLGEEYSAALESLSKRAPYCLEGRGLTVEMDDGSERLTVARDTVGATGPFPDCVKNEADVISDAFDRVDKVFSQLMRKQFGADLDVVEEENNKTKTWEELDTKTHLHVYRRSNKMTTAPLALPYHGQRDVRAAHPLLHPPAPHHLQERRSQPERKLYAAPHGLPALATILSSAPRTVIARMRVAPPGSLPSGARKTSPTFTSHFAAPLESETGATLARLVRQKRHTEGDTSGCSQEWPHAFEGGYRLPRTILLWNNGEPIGERSNVDAEGCMKACLETPNCAGWTLNTNNNWCGLKRHDQIKKGTNDGFVSGMIDRNSHHC